MEHLHHAHSHVHSRREIQPWHVPEAASRTAPVERTLTHLVPRATCTDDDAPGCTKPTQIPTLPIVLGVVIPIVGAAICWIWLHRRHRKKLREEDAKDKYKSLDFGVDFPGPKGGKGAEISVSMTEKGERPSHAKGISLDIGNPYIMPAGLNSSRESLHSLSRSMHDPNDPYRPVAFLKDDASMRSASRNGRTPYDQGSLYTTHTASSSNTDRMNNGLLKNAQRMSRSVPLRGESLSPDRETPEIRFPDPVAQPLSPLNPNSPSPPAANTSPAPAETQNDYFNIKGAETPAPASANQSGIPASLAPAPQAGDEPLHAAKAPVQPTPSPPPIRIQSQAAVLDSNPNTASFISDSSYGEGFKITPPSPPRSPPREHARIMSEEAPLAPAPLHPQKNAPAGLGVEQPAHSNNRLSIIGRPLPPDHPDDNPEQRANRIRSFYKEYFDDSKPEPAGGHVYHNDQYDYASEYLDGSVYDPQAGGFVVAQPTAPFAQPVTRRAMTPPPRAPPRFRSGSMGPRGPHMSNGSMSSNYMPPRGMSSMSGRFTPGPKKPLPPPNPLKSLPTPSMLKEDFMMINNPIEFAPPVTFRDRQNGLRPDSPMGAPRPFSPAVRPHTPLASSYDDLAVMPSPHLLRKSGTFTALDFAPPPRFREPGSAGGSDAGSIRSNRSGMSAAANYGVRTGAYRVSRIPKGVVGTKDDIVASLKPQMSLVAPS